jgi:cytochrome c2
MKFAPKSAAALAPVLLALAACGGGAEEADEPPAGATVEAAESTAPAGAETPAAGETPTPSETPSPTPSPSATAPAPVAVTEPASFAQCKACHSVEPGENGIGPSLAGVWGEEAGEVDDFEYSEAMEHSDLRWNQAALDRYLTDPRGVIPGTKMAFGGVKDAAQRQEIINYLKGL